MHVCISHSQCTYTESVYFHCHFHLCYWCAIAGAIIGGVVGGLLTLVLVLVAVILVIALLGFLMQRRKTVSGLCLHVFIAKSAVCAAHSSCSVGGKVSAPEALKAPNSR